MINVNNIYKIYNIDLLLVENEMNLIKFKLENFIHFNHSGFSLLPSCLPDSNSALTFLMFACFKYEEPSLLPSSLLYSFRILLLSENSICINIF